MIECLTCRSKLIQAFMHLQHRFLVCKTCFYKFLTHHNNNAFHRLSLLRNQITPQVRKLQHKFLQFVDSSKMQAQNIFNFKFVDLYDNYINQKYQSQQLSTEYSCAESDQYFLEQRAKFDLYKNYNWIREKLESNYTSVKESKLVEKVAENILPARQKLAQKGSIIMKSMSYLKKQLKSLKAESPSLEEIKSFDLGGLLRNKYKQLF